MSLIDILVLVASAAAAYTDVRTHRIPNALPISLCAAGLVVTIVHDWHGVAVFFGILALLVALGTALHAMKLLGGGDVKLIAAGAASYGVHDGTTFVLATILAGGVIAIVYATARGRFSHLISNLRLMAVPALAGVRPAPLSDGTKMPYALAIFSGALIVALMHVMH